MNEKSHFTVNVLSTVLGLATWFLVYYLLCYIFTVCLEYELFIRMFRAPAEHISMRNAYKFSYFLSYTLATVLTAFVVKKTAKCKRAVYPGIIVFSLVFIFLAADFVVIRMMENDKVFAEQIKETFGTVIYGVKFNFVSVRFNGGESHIVSSVLRLLPLCLVYYYAVKGKLKDKEKNETCDSEAAES